MQFFWLLHSDFDMTCGEMWRCVQKSISSWHSGGGGVGVCVYTKFSPMPFEPKICRLMRLIARAPTKDPAPSAQRRPPADLLLNWTEMKKSPRYLGNAFELAVGVFPSFLVFFGQTYSVVRCNCSSACVCARVCVIWNVEFTHEDRVSWQWREEWNSHSHLGQGCKTLMFGFFFLFLFFNLIFEQKYR